MTALFGLERYYLTFGQSSQFRDGYMVVWADSMRQARDVAFRTFGTKWSNVYDEEKFQAVSHYYPDGCIRELN